MSISMRLNKLREIVRENNLDGFLVSSAENRRYFSGFSGSAGYLLVSQTEAVLGTDFRYVEQAGRQAHGYRIERLPVGYAWLPELSSQLGIEKLGFESQHMTVDSHSAFQKAIGTAKKGADIALVEAPYSLDQLRAIKSGEEMSLLDRAIEITDQAFGDVASRIEVGMTEERVAWQLELAMRECGAEAMAFDIIVGAGLNSALPHHLADETVIREGEPIVIDMGARFDGYCADLTRTVFLGEPDEKFLHVYDVVLQAQLAAEEQVTPGMTGEDVDSISRDIITDAGYGDHFGHSLGHGVGLAVHEYPRVGPRAKERIENGMVFTIEPGIYLPGWGGVRIEDIVVMENGGARVLSKAPKLSLVA